MFGLITVGVIVIVSLIIAWNTAMIKINTKHTYTLGIILCLFLVIVETFRDGTINPILIYTYNI